MRTSVVVAIMLLTLAMIQPIGPSASSAAPSPLFDLGFGPSTLFPVSGGVPVYAPGDQLWIRSHYNFTVEIELSQALANSTTYKASLQPGVPVRVVTFNSTNPRGFWILVTLNLGPPSLLVLLSNPGQNPNLSLSGYKLSKGSLSMNLTLAPPQSLYGGEACVQGSSDLSSATIQVPRLLGTGSVILARQGNRLLAFSTGSGNYSVSFELYKAFSFLAPDSVGTLLTRNARVAETDAAILSAPNSTTFGASPQPGASIKFFVKPPTQNFTLRSDWPLTTGRYQLRAYFEGSGGASLATTYVLLNDTKNWVWLGGCQSTAVNSDAFGVSSALGANPAGWPRTVWLTYTSFGEQGFAKISLGINLAAVTFIGVPWGVKLSPYQIGINSTAGTRAVSVYNGSVYMIMNSPEASLTYALGLGNQSFFSGTVGSIFPFMTTNVSIGVSRLTVTDLVGGARSAGGTVLVKNPGGVLATSAIDASGKVVFYLPPGRYNITAIGGNATSTEPVTLEVGQSLSVTLGAGGVGANGQTVMDVLAVIAVAGIAANVAVLAARRRGRGIGAR